MGRQKEPTELLKLKGSWRAKDRDGREPKPEKGKPDIPENISEDGKKVWEKLEPLLENMNVLTKADGIILEMISETYTRWRDAEDKIKKFGTVFPIKCDKTGDVKYLQQSPFVGQANTAAKQLQSLLREVGLTPSARASLQVDLKEIEEPNIAKFLRNA